MYYGNAPFLYSNGAGGGYIDLIYLLEFGKAPSKTHGDMATPAHFDPGRVSIYRIPNGENSPVTVRATAEKSYSITLRPPRVPRHDIPFLVPFLIPDE